MRMKFRDLGFSKESLLRIEQANEIIEDYQAQGLRLTLRQLYYQFVSQDRIPNTERSYKNLGSIISKGRIAGLIDWDAIEDRMRRPNVPSEFESPRQLVEAALRAYRLPRRRNQTTYLELWVEKDALAGVLAPIAYDNHVTLMVNRGYSSSSAMYEASTRIRTELYDQFSDEAVILYLGDLDPSGEDMVRDIQDRLDTFDADVEVRKIALTMEQVREFNPPPNPTKLTDSRAKRFVEKYGTESWEVDALPPTELRTLIEEAIAEFTDEELIEKWKIDEDKHRLLLRKAVADL